MASLGLAERRKIRDRLLFFVHRRYANRRLMERDVGVSHSTAVGWFRPNPAPPRTEYLVRLATKKYLNLNWLLLGEGPELRGVDAGSDVWMKLRQSLVAELVSWGASHDDANAIVPSPSQLSSWLRSFLHRWDDAARNETVVVTRPGISREMEVLLYRLSQQSDPSKSTDVWSELRSTLVKELISRGASRQQAEAMVPEAKELFHSILYETFVRARQYGLR